MAGILARLEAEPDPSPIAGNRNVTPRDEVIAAVATSGRSTGTGLTDPRDLQRPSKASDIVIESEGGLEFDPTFAPFSKRALELIIDTLVLWLALLPGVIIAAVASSLWFVGLLVSLTGFVLFVVFAARSTASSGQSLGNRVAGTRVVDGINGANIDVGRAALRMTVRHLISTIFFFGFLIAFADGQRRTFHDRLASTVVIGRDREVWTADEHGA